ncbi:MAG: hypothetical protein RBR68_11865 [Tenuifilaceae bacterium]|nr:hypothetical protein [Tenuifilaceae bacterium]
MSSERIYWSIDGATAYLLNDTLQIKEEFVQSIYNILDGDGSQGITNGEFYQMFKNNESNILIKSISKYSINKITIKHSTESEWENFYIETSEDSTDGFDGTWTVACSGTDISNYNNELYEINLAVSGCSYIRIAGRMLNEGYCNLYAIWLEGEYIVPVLGLYSTDKTTSINSISFGRLLDDKPVNKAIYFYIKNTGPIRLKYIIDILPTNTESYYFTNNYINISNSDGIYKYKRIETDYLDPNEYSERLSLICSYKDASSYSATDYSYKLYIQHEKEIS